MVCWWWCSLVVVVSLRKYSILFLICIFLGYRILSQLCFSQQLRCGASVPWRALFHLPNLLSSPFFVLLCLFFLLVTFLWLIVLSNELWCASVYLSYFLSLSYLSFCVCGFKAFIISGDFSASNYEGFFLYSPVSNFLLDSIYIYWSILKVVSKFCDGQLIFPTFFPLLFSMSLFNILNTLQLHEYKDYCCSKHFNVLPC